MASISPPFRSPVTTQPSEITPNLVSNQQISNNGLLRTDQLSEAINDTALGLKQNCLWGYAKSTFGAKKPTKLMFFHIFTHR